MRVMAGWFLMAEASAWAMAPFALGPVPVAVVVVSSMVMVTVAWTPSSCRWMVLAAVIAGGFVFMRCSFACVLPSYASAGGDVLYKF